MAIINCKRCGKKHSSAASSCMHCGYPKKKIRNMPAKKKPMRQKTKTNNNYTRNNNDNTIKNLFIILGVLLLVTWIVDVLRTKNSYSASSSTSTTQVFSTNTNTNTNVDSHIERGPVVTTQIPSNAFRPLVAYVKKEMSNPGSFEHVSTTKQIVGGSNTVTMVYKEVGLSKRVVTKKIKAYVTDDGRIKSIER